MLFWASETLHDCQLGWTKIKKLAHWTNKWREICELVRLLLWIFSWRCDEKNPRQSWGMKNVEINPRQCFAEKWNANMVQCVKKKNGHALLGNYTWIKHKAFRSCHKAKESCKDKPILIIKYCRRRSENVLKQTGRQNRSLEERTVRNGHCFDLRLYLLIV